jgi:hypothetical protein
MTRARGASPRDFCHTRAPYQDVHWSMFAVVSIWDVHFMKLREPHHILQAVAAASVSHRVGALETGSPMLADAGHLLQPLQETLRLDSQDVGPTAVRW